jgi:hypothetical protein
LKDLDDHGRLSSCHAGQPEQLESTDQAGQTLETELGDRGMSQSQHPGALATENRRLRKLLLESMLEKAALKERRGNS